MTAEGSCSFEVIFWIKTTSLESVLESCMWIASQDTFTMGEERKDRVSTDVLVTAAIRFW